MRSLDGDRYSFNEEEDWENTSFSYFKVTDAAAGSVEFDIEGIDIREGIANANGNRILYIELLRLFGIEGHLIAENLGAYHRYNPEMFRIKIHGLKNNCMSIGAIGLGEEASGILKDFSMGVNVGKRVTEFREHILELIDRIRRYLDELRLWSTAMGADNREQCNIPGIPRERAAELHEAMSNLDLESIRELIDEVRQQKYSEEIEIFLDRMTDLSNQYDFDGAMRILTKVTEPL